MAKLPAPKEDAEQAVVVNYLRLRQNQYGGRLRFTHPPNGGVRPSRVDRSGRRFCNAGKKLEEQGVSPGFPDLLVIFDRYPGEERATHVAIEMKRANGRPSDVSSAQSEWLSFLAVCGWHTRACFGAQQAINFLRECGI